MERVKHETAVSGQIQGSEPESCAQNALRTILLGACVSQMIALAVDADDEHRTAVSVASRLAWCESRWGAAARCRVTDALAKAAWAEFFGASEKFNGEIGIVGGESGLHGAVMLVTKGKNIGPHRKRV